MYKTTQDIVSQRKQNATLLNTPVTQEKRLRALEINSHLKNMEILSKRLKSMSYADILKEYDAASDELIDANAAIQSISFEIQALSEQLKKEVEKQELNTIRIAAIADALRNHETPAQEKKQEEKKCANAPMEEKPKNIPDEDYRLALETVNGKIKALQILREEGFDV